MEGWRRHDDEEDQRDFLFSACVPEVSLSWLKWSTIIASVHSLNGTVTWSRALLSTGNTINSHATLCLVQTLPSVLVPDWTEFMKAAEYDKQSCLRPKSTLECLGPLIPSQTPLIWCLALLITCCSLQGLTAAPVKAGYATLGSATCPLLSLTGVFMPSLTSALTACCVAASLQMACVVFCRGSLDMLLKCFSCGTSM